MSTYDAKGLSVNAHATAVRQAIEDAKPDFDIASDALVSLTQLFLAANRVPDPGRPRSRYAQALAAHMSRAYGLLDAILILCHKGYSSEAQLMLRGLLELALSAAYLSEADHDARTGRFLEYEAVYKRKLAADMLRMESNSDNERAASLREKVVRLGKDVQRFERRYKAKNRLQQWYGMDVASLSRHLGQRWFEWYMLVYRPASWYAHPTVDSLAEVIHQPSPVALDQHATLLFGPTAVKLSVVLKLAVWFALKIAIPWSSTSRIEEAAWQELKPLFERLEKRIPPSV